MHRYPPKKTAPAATHEVIAPAAFIRSGRVVRLRRPGLRVHLSDAEAAELGDAVKPIKPRPREARTRSKPAPEAGPGTTGNPQPAPSGKTTAAGTPEPATGLTDGDFGGDL